MEKRSMCSNIVNCLNLFQGDVSANHVRSFKVPGQNTLYGEIIIHILPGKSRPGKPVSVQLHSASNVDSDTGKGTLTHKVLLKHGNIDKGMQNEHGAKAMRYELEFKVEPDFGTPGALIIKNELKHNFFLQSASFQVYNNQIVHFECNSWIYPVHLTKQDRIFFSNTCYLPKQTPVGLLELRKEDLARLRGDGTGERREWDRIYDYDYYNELSNPGKDLARPVIGGSETFPYPRRLRTGRPPNNYDIRTESCPRVWFNMDLYVPPDERLSQKKLSEFTSNVVQAAMQFVNKESSNFESFDQIHRLFTGDRGHSVDEKLMKLLKQELPNDLFKKVKQVMDKKPVKFPPPQIAAGNEFAWMDDGEFGRQMLAGTNPTVISCIKSFPPKGENGVKSSIKESDIERNLDGLSIKEAMNQWRIFKLDHHDYLMPFLRRINTENGVYAYASRTILFLRDDSTLKPIVIELSVPGPSPGEEINRVFFPSPNGPQAALWQLAKAHVAATDSCYHQLINHWLETHAVVEPFIIATKRQLSAMHPIHRLLSPHFKDTIQVNALARSMLLNAGGILETTLFTGEVSMELSSSLYKKWRFDEQSLPADLIKRGMAFYNPNQPENIELLIEDYPYAADGLDIWICIKNWVTRYCSYFYEDDDPLKSDDEIKEWWSEIRYIGHGDKHNESWWYAITTRAHLIENLTTLIWIVSALHAAVSLGQYDYKRITACRKPIPSEGTMEFVEFLMDPDKYFLSMLPKKFEMTLGIAVVDVLSKHMADETCLGQLSSPEWIDDEEIQKMFKLFGDELGQVKERIRSRNQDPMLKNRRGKGGTRYEVFCPETSSEVRSSDRNLRSGIPNSTFM